MSTQEGAEEMFFEESSLAPESHERVGYVQNVNNVNNPTKRKRFNTGSIDYDSFNTMGSDDKLNHIFAKLLNIERTQSEVTSMQQTLRHTDERLQRTVGHVDNNTYKLQHLAYKYLDLETKIRRKNIIMYGLAENHNSYPNFEGNNQQKTKNHELLRDKYQNVHVLTNFFIQGVSPVCATATVMTIFVDNGDKEN